MPQVYYLNNYCYEINGLSLTVYKYDIFENNYYPIDKCLIDKKIPKKYETILNDINKYNSTCCESIITQFNQLQLAS